MTNERLKMWIDLGKWSIVSVGLVLMTKIIDAGFKDREVGIKEITAYDKYTKIITDNNRLAERRMLAQFFANVAPSDNIRAGWKRYFDVIDKEYKLYVDSLASKKNELQLLEKKLMSSKTSNVEIIEKKKIEAEINSLEKELMLEFSNIDSIFIDK